MANNPLTPQQLLRTIRADPVLDAEIVQTMPPGSTINQVFSNRQALIILRVCLNERCSRARSLWDNKGRMTNARAAWYHALTEAQLNTVGLSWGPNPSGQFRLYNAPMVFASDQAPPFAPAHPLAPSLPLALVPVLLPAVPVVAPIVPAVPIAPAVDQDYYADEEESDEEEDSLDVLDENQLDAEKNARAYRTVNDNDESDGRGPVQGADSALTCLGDSLDAKIDADGNMNVSIGWLHNMDGPRVKRGVICDCMLEQEGEDGKEDGEKYHVVDILFDTNNINLPKFLQQVDSAVQGAFPDAEWDRLKLHAVECYGWVKSDDGRLEVNVESVGMPEGQVRDLSADVKFMQLFVGYEYVSEKVACFARRSWAAV